MEGEVKASSSFLHTLKIKAMRTTRRINSPAVKYTGVAKAILDNQQQQPRVKQNFNAPQYPGEQKGQTMDQVKAFIMDQVRRKGFVFSGGTTAQDFKIELSGTARFFYGLTFQNIIGTITLIINNEVVFENVSSAFLQFGSTNQDYYAVNRPLSGQDDIKITITGFAGYTNQQMEVVYK